MRLSFAVGAAAFALLALAASTGARGWIDRDRPGAFLDLAEPPGLGITCGNLTTCGRIGIAVRLTEPALRVDAELLGASVRMHEGATTRSGGYGPSYWEGYVHVDLHRLGLPVYWYGNKPVKFLVLRLTIRYADGTAQGAVRLVLHPGWG